MAFTKSLFRTKSVPETWSCAFGSHVQNSWLLLCTSVEICKRFAHYHSKSSRDIFPIAKVSVVVVSISIGELSRVRDMIERRNWHWVSQILRKRDKRYRKLMEIISVRSWDNKQGSYIFGGQAMDNHPSVWWCTNNERRRPGITRQDRSTLWALNENVRVVKMLRIAVYR